MPWVPGAKDLELGFEPCDLALICKPLDLHLAFGLQRVDDSVDLHAAEQQATTNAND